MASTRPDEAVGYGVRKLIVGVRLFKAAQARLVLVDDFKFESDVPGGRPCT